MTLENRNTMEATLFLIQVLFIPCIPPKSIYADASFYFIKLFIFLMEIEYLLFERWFS